MKSAKTKVISKRPFFHSNFKNPIDKIFLLDFLSSINEIGQSLDKVTKKIGVKIFEKFHQLSRDNS